VSRSQATQPAFEPIPGILPFVDSDAHRKTLWRRAEEITTEPPDTCGRTCKGTSRICNQDNFIVENLGQDVVLLAVADGLGGMAHGEIASKMAVELLSGFIHEGLVRGNLDDHKQVEPLLRRAILRADQTISNRGRQSHCQMGTTVVVALIVGGCRAWVANVGDSRCYLQRNGELTQLTRDHTYLNMMAEAGVLNLDEDQRRKYSNVLVQSVGTSHRTFVDIEELELMEGDQLLLCSDGLWGPLTPEQIDHRLQAGDNADITCDALLWESLIAGGTDDLTCIVHQQK